MYLIEHFCFINGREKKIVFSLVSFGNERIHPIVPINPDQFRRDTL